MIVHMADETGNACRWCHSSFGRLTVEPGTRVESEGAGNGVGYQTWHPLDVRQGTEAEPCFKVTR